MSTNKASRVVTSAFVVAITASAPTAIANNEDKPDSTASQKTECEIVSNPRLHSVAASESKDLGLWFKHNGNPQVTKESAEFIVDKILNKPDLSVACFVDDKPTTNDRMRIGSHIRGISTKDISGKYYVTLKELQDQYNLDPNETFLSRSSNIAVTQKFVEQVQASKE